MLGNVGLQIRIRKTRQYAVIPSLFSTGLNLVFQTLVSPEKICVATTSNSNSRIKYHTMINSTTYGIVTVKLKLKLNNIAISVIL